ncbi:hypothetical protein B0J12DRAFT_662803 [Macrophomina phaseolina]|uniref:Uncharacterized protein n=1 Tax=Macrophomina phaseolina TaxID=35725 RepID=A0ABQ8GC68_9PEZI|nr:hypothetical protein B0J12DRAFT_662803 [Macrophomina phaseolina]
MQPVGEQQEEEFVPVDELTIGLDRSKINTNKQIQLPDHDSRASDPDVHKNDSEHHPSSESTRSYIKQRKHGVAVKLRKTFHVGKSSDFDDAGSSSVLAGPTDETPGSSIKDKFPDRQTLKELYHNPIDTVKAQVGGTSNEQVAANIAAKEIPHEQDVELINASNAVERAKTEQKQLLAIQDLSRLIKYRQETFARWTLDRHITKIRVLPRETFKKKPRKVFQTRNAHGEIVTDWRAYAQHLLEFYAQQYGGQYIGSSSDPPHPSKHTIMPNVERLIIASSPFQEFIMTTRRVYRWENQKETIKYLIIYLTLWYFNLLLPGVLSAIFYLVVERRIHGQTLENLREDIKHTDDQQRTALSLSEFIEKEGTEKWADELLENLGPWLMVQLADMANFFESVRNFYEWRVPHRTLVTLGILAAAILATAFLPLRLLVKSSTFGAGFTFFALFPLSTNFPEYRLLVSPSKRIFWNIPTHAEWAVKFIQAEGSQVEGRASPAPSPPSPSKQAQDYSSYTAHQNGSSGRLIISVLTIRFASNDDRTVQWILPYDQIERIEKQDRIAAKNIPKLRTDSGKDLLLTTKSGEEWLLENMDKRDEAFSQIVGFSRTNWQVVW